MESKRAPYTYMESKVVAFDKVAGYRDGAMKATVEFD